MRGVHGACGCFSALNRRRDFSLIRGLHAGQALRELAREFAKRVAFDRAQSGDIRLRNAGKMQDVFSRWRARELGGYAVSLVGLVAVPDNVLDDCIRCLAPLRQGIEQCDLTADAEPAIAAKGPVSIE